GSLEGHALDHIGIKRALDKEVRSGKARGLPVEHLDEHATDNFSFLFGVRHPGKGIQKLTTGIHVDEVQVKVVAKHVDDLLRFVFPEQPVVHEDAREAVADGTGYEHRRHGRIDATRETAE